MTSFLLGTVSEIIMCLFWQHFLWILKTVHSGADLDVMLEMSKGSLDDDLKGMLYNILGNRDAW